MSYHTQILLAALDASQGNITNARNEILQRVKSDHELLQGLTQQMLPGIVTYALEKLQGKHDGGFERSSKVSEAPQRPAPEFDRDAALQDPVDLDDLMAAMAKTINTTNETSQTKPKSGKGKVSQGHIDAIHAIAKRKYH